MTGTTTALPNQLYDERQIVGKVAHVTRSTLELELSRLTQTNGHTNGSSIPGTSVGDYVIIEAGPFAIFGQLTDVRSSLDDVSSSSLQTHTPIATIQLYNSIEVQTGKIANGVAEVPKLGNNAYAASAKLVQLIVESRHRAGGEKKKVLLNFACLPDPTKTSISLTPEMMFGRHLAFLGTTGAGKSWSIARLCEETARFQGKVILFDATGEFHTMRRGTRHVYLGNDPKPLESSREVVLPFYQLTESDLFAIFKPRGQSQAPKLRSAIKSLKLVTKVPEITPDGFIIKAHRSKKAFEDAYRKHRRFIENASAEFNIKNLARQIEYECVIPNRSSMEPHFWGDVNGGDHAACVPLITRIQDIISSRDLAPVFDPRDKPSLFRAIDLFLQDEDSRVLRVSLQHLSFAHNAREIIANAIGRHLLQLGRKGRFRENPLLVILDEAHQFLNKSVDDQDSIYPLDAFEIVAKEGRKYSLNICLATQRPRDIPEGVLSQIGTLVVHRLINDRDRSVVERASGEIDQSTLATLPTLTPGEAVILGVDFPVPLSVQVESPKYSPESDGPDYQKFWS